VTISQVRQQEDAYGFNQHYQLQGYSGRPSNLSNMGGQVFSDNSSSSNPTTLNTPYQVMQRSRISPNDPFTKRDISIGEGLSRSSLS